MSSLFSDNKVAPGQELPTAQKVDNVPTPDTLLLVDAQDLRRQRRRRKWRILTCFMFLGLWLWGRSIIKNRRETHELVWSEDWKSPSGHACPHKHPYYPIPHDVELGECVTWEFSGAKDKLELHHASAQLALELASGISFISSGSSSFGEFVLDQAEASKDQSSKEAKVDIQVEYADQDYLEDLVKVCKLTRKKDNSTGLGIFTPKWQHRGHPHHRFPKHYTYFKLSVQLPAAKGDEPLNIPSLSTEFTLFNQSVANLKEGVFFDKVSLVGVNGGIGVESLTGTIVDVISVNGPISGTFWTNSTIKLANVNGHIDAQLVLHNSNKSAPTTAIIGSVNGNIAVPTNLTTSSDNEGGGFSIQGSTISGSLSVIIPEAPVDHQLALKAKSVRGKVSVGTHPAYQGPFHLSTVLGKVEVDWNKKEQDPAGRGRTRNVEITNFGRGNVKGLTWWGDEDEGKSLGSVELESTLADLKLLL